MNNELSMHEVRVIGCLMEKAVTTPDQYPLSLNALHNACNQKSSREPVLNLDPGVVQRTVNELMDRNMIMTQSYGSRVDRYAQIFCNAEFGKLQFSAAEFAVVCLLLLRGPQTPGELKTRSERLHHFADLEEVEETMDALMERADGPFVARLPLEPRRKDCRYAHLFSGHIESAPKPEPSTRPTQPRRDDRIDELESRVEALESELASLKRELGAE